jgi:predicted permease
VTVRAFLQRIRYLLRRDRLAGELEEEMRLHLELRAARFEQSGLSNEAAAYAARRRFGNVPALQETSRDLWGFAGVGQLVQDLRYAMRRLRQRPSFSIPILGALALGIGATTAVFSAVDAAVFRPLPFGQPEQLLTLTNIVVPSQLGPDQPFPPDLNDVHDLRGVFADAAGFAAGGLNLSDPENPQRLRVGVVTTGFFSTLGVLPQQGRTFATEEGKPNGPLVAILSHALWQRRYGGRAMLGKNISLNGKAYSVIGVMRSGFSFPNESDLWIPMTVPTTWQTFEPFRGWLPSRVVARLAPGITPDAASANLLALWQRLAPAREPGRRFAGEDMLEEAREKGVAIPLQRVLVGDRQRALFILLGATGFLLLIACANVANLLLSDAAVRRREIAVRQVLGATRTRVVRQLLAESVLLSLGGALLGIALAPAALHLIRAMFPGDLAGVAPAQLDLRVLAFATGLALVTGLAFGLWPALGSTGGDASATIRSGGGHGATAGKLGRSRRALVAGELALTVMLLVGAGLMLKSFDRLLAQELGMNPDRVATLELTFARSAAPRAERFRLIHSVIDRLSAQPGIDAVGAVNDLPLGGGGGIALSVQMDGVPTPTASDRMRFARYLMASGGYFKAMGIPLLRGRTFTATDDSLSPRVAIISKTMATAWLPGIDPIGRTFRMPNDSVPYMIVGVVADVRELKLDQDPMAQMYFPIDKQLPEHVAFVVHGMLTPQALLARLTEAVRGADPSQPVFNVRMMDEVIGKSVAARRTNTLLIALFAALALLFSVLGVYAVVAYGVAQRSREFGIRAAFGARAGDLLALVSREMAVVAALGIALGLGAAWALSRVLAALLYDVGARDPATFIAVPLVLLVPIAIATLLPARRAMHANPIEVIRTD